MPRSPILSREGLYKKLPDGTIHFLDWNLVNTPLGAMLEPRQVGIVGGGGKTGLLSIDAVDAGFTRLVETNEDVLAYQSGTSGLQLPVDFSR